MAGASADVYPVWPNLAAMMLDRAATWPDRPMLRHFAARSWHGISWQRFAERAAAAAGLRAHGVEPGDRVLLCSENRPEVLIAEVALMALGAVPMPAYTTNLPADHAWLLADSQARLAVASTPNLAERVTAGAQLTGKTLPVLAFDAVETAAADPALLRAEAARIAPGQLACLIYTSGTSGQPRGVMLSHRAILANLRGAAEMVRPLAFRDEVYLSFLPLSHAYEHTIGGFFLPSLGVEIAYGRGMEHLSTDFRAVRPTIITAVPRILDVVQSRILGSLARGPAWKRRVFLQALAAGLRRIDGRDTILDHLLRAFHEKHVYATIAARFGGRLRAVMSGGARLDPDLERFYRALGLLVMQGYGQTEAGPVIAANTPGAMRTGTVGRTLDGVDLHIAPDGEILVRGDLVMDGYWNQPEATAAALRDGWLHTGDVGHLDAEGFLAVSDRKRDLIVLSGGENVSPARVEAALCAEPEIEQAVVAGDGKSGLYALLVPAPASADAALAEAVIRVNARLAAHERIRRHRSVPAFTVENGLLTPSHKIRRALVLKAHGE